MEMHFIVLFTTLLSFSRVTESHEHPRRHRHNYRKGQFLDNISWDDMHHNSHSENKLDKSPDLDDFDKWTHSRTKAESHRHEEDLERTINNENYFSDKSLSKYRKKIEENHSTFSNHFFNKTIEDKSLSKKAQEEDRLINESFQNERKGETLEDQTTEHDSHFEPKASEAKGISSFSDDTFLSAPRWTLKYQGIVSEQALNNTQRNVTASVGGNAFLPCKVGHLGDRQISWIRRRDWHVLTSGKILYTYDQRFSVLHEPGSQDWTLHIKWVNMKDSGTYECQVSTGTGIISLFVNLKVVIPKAFIPGHGQYHVNKGSSISLKCYINNSPSPPQYILWHHNGELLNFLRNRPDLVITDDLNRSKNQFIFSSRNLVRTDLSSTATSAEETPFVSQLSVELAEERHSGNYTCSAPNTEAASTLVFITEGDKTAAVQRIDSAAPRFLPDKKQSIFLEIFFFVLLKISFRFT